MEFDLLEMSLQTSELEIDLVCISIPHFEQRIEPSTATNGNVDRTGYKGRGSHAFSHQIS
jgi:hypothetical protein